MGGKIAKYGLMALAGVLGVAAVKRFAPGVAAKLGI